MFAQLSAGSESEDERSVLFPPIQSSFEETEESNILIGILNETGIISPNSPYRPRFILFQFILLAIFFSANHGSVVACLSLASGRLGELGNYQSSLLYMAYTFSAIFGSTFIVKSIGPKRSITIGMWVYCVYVGCFVVATLHPTIAKISVILGAITGGLGGGFLWTAQGSYLARASEEYAFAKGRSIEDTTNLFSGIFAGTYLGFEVILKLFSSTMLIRFGWSWLAVFSGYTFIAIVASFCMIFVIDLSRLDEDNDEQLDDTNSKLYRATVTFRLLANDPKMMYMIPLSAAFALSSVFLNTFINGEVVRVALEDSESEYVGLLTSITAAVGGIMSLLFGYIAPVIGNDVILIIGCVSFFTVSFSFFLFPTLTTWNMPWIIFIYVIQGVGRATFEGSMKAEFAIVFPDKEAAFGNIVFQNGIMTTLGFTLMSSFHCNHLINPYCVEFGDGKRHCILAFEVIVMIVSMSAIYSYRRGKQIYKQELEEDALNFRLINEDHLL